MSRVEFEDFVSYNEHGKTLIPDTLGFYPFFFFFFPEEGQSPTS